MKTRKQFAKLIDELVYKTVLSSERTRHFPNLGQTEFGALRFISFHEPTTMKAIAEYLGVSMPRCTVIVDRLCDDDLVKRLKGTDRRQVLISTTSSAQKTLEKTTESYESISEEVLTVLSANEREQMYNLLSKCLDNFEKSSIRK